MEVSNVGRLHLSVLVILGVSLSSLSSLEAAPPSYRVIVHQDVKGARIPRGVLSSIFLKQAPKWSDGTPIHPVDQSVRSEVRRSFSGDVLSQGVAEVQVYWQRRMTQGVLPPLVKGSDEEVVAFVGSHPGAIGYVSGATALPDTVKAIELVD
jgi:ABC-type phosphate transport system substrate-binding protein